MTATKTKQTQLQTLAGNMRTLVAAGARYMHTPIGNDLEAVLQRRIEQSGAERWRLALGRRGLAPSADEVIACREAFGVPAGTEVEVKAKQRTGKTGIVSTWHIVEMYWYEA